MKPTIRVFGHYGVELHLRGDLPKPKPGEVEELLVNLKMALRMHLR